ncbi:MAG TPA: ATP-binding protein [Candidatus Acidoferrales bacterium]|nr:ATP-binding protein [Candidatus Acidoferrales bacterium]
MRRFRDRPIGQKLAIVTMMTTAAALIPAGVGIMAADSLLFRDYLRRDLTALARIIAENSTAALAFNDPDAASQTLGALRARAHVDAACIYQPDGTLLARYFRDGITQCPPLETRAAIQFAGRYVTVSQPVLLNGQRIGTLMLFYNLGEMEDRLRLFGSAVAAVLLIASLVAYLLSSRLNSVIATPISRLVNATTSVSKTGDYGIRAEKLSGDELGVLVDRFNEMLAGIQSRDQNLKEALIDREAALHEVERERERFAFMAESMPQKIFAAAPNGESVYLNRQWMEYTGLSYEQIISGRWAQFVHPDDLEESRKAWRASIGGGNALQLTNRLRRFDGSYRWHLHRARAMRNADGRIALWIGSSTDIHEQKEKEEELRRANEDLQQFAYSASHDLQEPIRNVAVYSEVISRRYHHVLDSEGQLYLGFLKEGGRRLATLVNDLLAYTRASRAELSETRADSSAALRNAIAALSEAIRESHASVTWEPLPEVHMGESHLQQIFQNLIGNALKYRSDAPPQVHISAISRGAFWRFAVQDNGIGIDPLYKEKIFGLFKRLHHDQKYGGTGIGLAICQRVVERYGGRIWVESEPGSGSTFYFTVPQHVESAWGSTLQSAAS